MKMTFKSCILLCVAQTPGGDFVQENDNMEHIWNSVIFSVFYVLFMFIVVSSQDQTISSDLPVADFELF